MCSPCSLLLVKRRTAGWCGPLKCIVYIVFPVENNLTPTMALALFQRLFNWVKGLFWKTPMTLSVIGVHNSGKSTLVNVMSVSKSLSFIFLRCPMENRDDC